LANGHIIQVEKDDYDYHEIFKIIISKILTTINTYIWRIVFLQSANLQVHSPSSSVNIAVIRAFGTVGMFENWKCPNGINICDCVIQKI